ncbi:MAG: LolA family protein [Leptonema sp. (in: bacteria)]
MKKKFSILFYFLFINTIHSDILESVVNKFHNSIFKANFSIERSLQQQKGVLYYQKGQIHIRLSDGTILASNYKNILTYDPDSKVAGKQEKIPGGGFQWILAYPRKIEGNKAVIEPNDKNYQKIIIHWNTDLFPISITFIKDPENKISIKFSNIIYLNNISSQFFSYKPPPGSRTVENPLNLKK